MRFYQKIIYHNFKSWVIDYIDVLYIDAFFIRVENLILYRVTQLFFICDNLSSRFRIYAKKSQSNVIIFLSFFVWFLCSRTKTIYQKTKKKFEFIDFMKISFVCLSLKNRLSHFSQISNLIIVLNIISNISHILSKKRNLFATKSKNIFTFALRKLYNEMSINSNNAKNSS